VRGCVVTLKSVEAADTIRPLFSLGALARTVAQLLRKGLQSDTVQGSARGWSARHRCLTC